MKRPVAFLSVCLMMAELVPYTLGQTSSIGAKERIAHGDKPLPFDGREAVLRPRNVVYERYGWIASTPAPPKTFKPGDLITIIVREQRKWEADADLDFLLA